MQRKVVITEEHGFYRLQSTSGVEATGPSVRAVMRSAEQQVRIRQPSVFEVIELLLGERREDGGQIHTGVVST